MKYLLLPLALAALCSAGHAQGEAAPAASCLMVYGHGRNIGEPAQNEAWDRINARFNAAVTGRLEAAGLKAWPLVFKVGATDIGEDVQMLLGEAARQGCTRVVDTAVFGDENKALIVRMRVHPLLGSVGPLAGSTLPRVGEPIYTGQNDFDLNLRTLERLNLEALASSMVNDYLLKTQATAASR